MSMCYYSITLAIIDNKPSTQTPPAATASATTAPTLPPVISFEAIYKDFFSLGLAKSDLTATKTSFEALLTKLSVNTAQVNN
jgi:hypothetical protein